jgi:serine/threonine-protein kinase HipA
VGDNNHYKISDITPRHFIQTADRCKFDQSKLIAELEQLLALGEKTAQSTISGLAHKLPDQLTDSVLACIVARIRSISLWPQNQGKSDTQS